MPAEPIKRAFRSVAARFETGGLDSRQIDHHPARADVIKRLAAQFDVSELTMEIRLERDGLLARLTPPPGPGGQRGAR